MPPTIESELAELRAHSLLRRLREFDSAQQPAMATAGKQLVNFSSNDYLGLATEPALKDAAKGAIDQYGVGAGASRLVCGTLTPHVRLEERLAEFKRTPAALTFSSGYATALGTLGALLQKDDVAILDKLSHASLIDGAKLSGAVVRVFPHNHLGRLESHLKWARDHYPEARVVVVTESVFSMDGDWAALAEIVEIKNRYGALLLLDEAHAVGVVGQHGRGLADQLGLGAEIDIHMGTLSKALGTSGGYICGGQRLIDLVINRGRSFIYSTAPSPGVAAAATAAVEFMLSANGERRRQQLRANLATFADEMPQLFAGGRKLQSAIIPIILGTAEAAISAAQSLADKGFLVPAIRFPTVARDSARLRVTISAKHTARQIAELCAVLRPMIAARA
ncbi:MAG: 8-amino-7-ketopelargonate synthase [Chthoniobacter sp.]|jgi:8-amino-7-oxononanoate synthase|nr:8-amino-7-ketopelargonate synthase [Chthoniobacter sp.]